MGDLTDRFGSAAAPEPAQPFTLIVDTPGAVELTKMGLP
jgi:hypothetical protein